MTESLIYVGGSVLDVNDLTHVNARSSVATRITRNGNSDNSRRYTVEMFTDETSRTIEAVLSENVESIKRLISQYRDPSLPGIPFVVDGESTEVVGQEAGRAGMRRVGSVPKAS